MFGQMQGDYNLVMHAKLGTQDPSPVYRMFDEGHDALLSVGGVDYEGRPLVMSRSGEGSCPEAVALGLGGVGADPEDPEDLEGLPPFLSGTSVSAAIATAFGWLPRRRSSPKGDPGGEVGVDDPGRADGERLTSLGKLGRSGRREFPLEPAGQDPVRGAVRPGRGVRPRGSAGLTARIRGRTSIWLGRRGACSTLRSPKTGRGSTVYPAPVCTRGSSLRHGQRRGVVLHLATQPPDPLCFRCGVTLVVQSGDDQTVSNSGDDQMLTFWSRAVTRSRIWPSCRPRW